MVRGRSVVSSLPVARRWSPSTRATASRHRRRRLLAFAAGTIVLLWATFLERRTEAAAVAALFYAAFAPGQIYYYAVFPLSMLTFATVACLWLLCRERYLAAGATGAVAALAYPVGVLLAPIAAVWLIAQRRVPLGERLRRVALACGPILAGVWILMIVQRIDAGRWDAFFLIQEKYEELHGSQNPFVATWDIVRGGVENLSSGISVVVALQTAFVSIVLVLLLVFAFRRRRSLDRVDGSYFSGPSSPGRLCSRRSRSNEGRPRFYHSPSSSRGSHRGWRGHLLWPQQLSPSGWRATSSMERLSESSERLTAHVRMSEVLQPCCDRRRPAVSSHCMRFEARGGGGLGAGVLPGTSSRM